MINNFDISYCEIRNIITFSVLSAKLEPSITMRYYEYSISIKTGVIADVNNESIIVVKINVFKGPLESNVEHFSETCSMESLDG